MKALNLQGNVAADSNQIIKAIVTSSFKEVKSKIGYSELVQRLAESISKKLSNQLVVVSIVGGEACGKTTLAGDICAALSKLGIAADHINTDDYNKGTRAWRWEHFEGKKLRDLRQKYDFELMNDKISLIRQNEHGDYLVPVPTYDEISGLALEVGEHNYSHKIGKINVLIVEGILHAVAQHDLLIYIHAADSFRLQTRIRRDHKRRKGAETDKITDNFNLRQAKLHFPHTLKAASDADVIVSTKPVNTEKWIYDIYQKNA